MVVITIICTHRAVTLKKTYLSHCKSSNSKALAMEKTIYFTFHSYFLQIQKPFRVLLFFVDILNFGRICPICNLGSKILILNNKRQNLPKFSELCLCLFNYSVYSNLFCHVPSLSMWIVDLNQ